MPNILKKQNPAPLFSISDLIQEEVDKDWWDQLPQEVRASIFEGIEDIEMGKVFTNEQVIQEPNINMHSKIGPTPNSIFYHKKNLATKSKRHATY